MFKPATIFPRKRLLLQRETSTATPPIPTAIFATRSRRPFKSQGLQLSLPERARPLHRLPRAVDSDAFIILPGLEASANLVDPASGQRLKTHHMHGILGTTAMQEKSKRPFQPQGISPRALSAKASGTDSPSPKMYATRSNPTAASSPITIHLSRVDADDFCDLDGIWALEICNYNTVNESATGYDTTYWDKILRSGRQLFAFASDDNHNEGLFDDACGGWISVKAERLDHDAIVGAMSAASIILQRPSHLQLGHQGK